MNVSSPLALEIAETAARLIVDEGLEWGPAKRRAVKQMGLPPRTALPDNAVLEVSAEACLASRVRLMPRRAAPLCMTPSCATSFAYR